MLPNRANDELIKTTRSLVDQIHVALERPWSFEEGRGVFDRYKESSGKTNVSKLVRNASFIQRLYKMQDEIINSVISVQILRDEVALTDIKHGLKADTVKNKECENISLTTERAITSFCNGLAYFFDFPSKDDFYNMVETVNFTYLRDDEIGESVAALVQSDGMELNGRVNDELRKGYFGLPKIAADGILTLKAAKTPTIDELAGASEDVLLSLHKVLNVLLNSIDNRYKKNLGYTSFNDLIVQSDANTGTWLHSPENAIKEPNLFKIFNFWDKSTSPIEGRTFRIRRNYLYDPSLEKRYRSTDQQIKTFKMSAESPLEVSTSKKKAQEGEYAWTHTLDFKRPMKRTGTARRRLEDICLSLTLITGYGVYSDDSARSFSHKAKGMTRYHDFEYAGMLFRTIYTLNTARKDEAVFYRLILAKYRQALQPATIEGGLVRLWEILDVIADFYCVDNMKGLPKGYQNYDELKLKLEAAFKVVQEEIKVPLVGEVTFAPLRMDKSIAQKVRDALKKFTIAQLVGVSQGNLNKRIGGVYRLRSKLTHSAASNKNSAYHKELMNTYLFMHELVFLIMTRIFNHPDSETLNSLKA